MPLDFSPAFAEPPTFDGLPPGVKAIPTGKKQRGKRGLALTTDHDLSGFEFRVVIDTLKLEVVPPPTVSRRALRQHLREKLGVSVLIILRKHAVNGVRPWLIVIQDVSAEVMGRIVKLPEFFGLQLSTATIVEAHFALDAYLRKHTDIASDDKRRRALRDALFWHFHFPEEVITAKGGGPRWFDTHGKFLKARQERGSDGLPFRLGLMDEADTIYVGPRWAGADYMIIHKTTDQRWKGSARDLPNRERRVRIELRLRGREAQGWALNQTLDDIAWQPVMQAIASEFFRFVCPVVSEPTPPVDVAFHVRLLLARRQAAIFASWGVWAVIDRHNWARRGSAERVMVDGVRRYSPAARPPRLLAHHYLNERVYEAFKRTATALARAYI